VLGMIPDGDRLLHVVYRHESTWPDSPPDEAPQHPLALDPEESAFLADRARSPLKFATLRRQADGEWLMIADHSFPGVEDGFVIGVADGSEDDANGEGHR